MWIIGVPDIAVIWISKLLFWDAVMKEFLSKYTEVY